MALKKQLRKRLGSIVFIIVVALSGMALAASGNLRNPLTAISEFTTLVGGSTSTQGGAGGAPSGEMRGAPPSGEMPAGGGDASGIQWNQLGAVLYNLWVIAAASAIVMVVGPAVGWSIKGLGRATKRLTPARAPA